MDTNIPKISLICYHGDQLINQKLALVRFESNCVRPSKQINVSRPGCGKILERGHFYFLFFIVKQL